ncbi:MAG: nicotinamide riboside transporter PnuC [Prevotellaceae bacterium]|jgi:nicotinamide mononucleotide transporter|nr:nicotinamide riboside transporter PnuC [Prevotellaceae bacterium]
MTDFFSIKTTAFQIIGYTVSYVELTGTVFGFVSVWLASKANILTWPAGVVNEFFLFLLFYQTQLYADMFLQVYFFAVTVSGWRNWRRETVKNRILSVSRRNRVAIALTIAAGSLTVGFLIQNIHVLLPRYFAVPASWPFTDSTVMALSIAATVLLAQKRVESWLLWIAVDVICTVLYFKKAIWFLSFEYFVFLWMAVYGLSNWRKQMKNG